MFLTWAVFVIGFIQFARLVIHCISGTKSIETCRILLADNEQELLADKRQVTHVKSFQWQNYLHSFSHRSVCFTWIYFTTRIILWKLSEPNAAALAIYSTTRNILTLRQEANVTKAFQGICKIAPSTLPRIAGTLWTFLLLSIVLLENLIFPTRKVWLLLKSSWFHDDFPKLN